jgi:hypothetical protein
MEREAEDPEFFQRFSPNGYALVTNMVLYALTHQAQPRPAGAGSERAGDRHARQRPEGPVNVKTERQN